MSLFYKTTKDGYGNEENNMKAPIVVISGLIVSVIVIIGLMFLLPAYSRNQRLLNERNQTQVNDIQIAQTQQLVKVQEQKAQIQIAQAHGIATSQAIIKESLTPLYIQYLAIEAQKEQVNGQNHTVIYVPSGNNGIPLVQTTSPTN